MASFKCKPVRNKKTGQINISVPKKSLPKHFFKDFSRLKSMKLKVEKMEYN